MSFSDEKTKILNFFSNEGIFPSNLIETFNKEEVFLAGGAIISLFSDSPINDYDLFFRTEQSFKTIKNLFKKNGWNVQFKTKSAVRITKDEIKIHLINKIYGEPIDVINNFDFQCCSCSYDFKINNFIMNKYSLKQISKRELIYNLNTDNPTGALFRIPKYEKKGFSINNFERLKIILAIQQLYFETMEDVVKNLNVFYGLNQIHTTEFLSKKFNLEEFLKEIKTKDLTNL